MLYYFDMKDKSKAKEETQIAITERIGPGVLMVRLNDDIDPNVALHEVQDLFDTWFKNGISRIVFDMSNLEFPNGSFIAMLIEKTSEARRRGGDIKIINLPKSAHNNLTMFTPLTYLSIGTDALSVFDDVVDLDPASMEKFVDFEEGKPRILQVEASVDALNKVTHYVTVCAQKAGIERIEQSKLKIAVYEACMNVIEHGYCFESGKFMIIEVLWDNGMFKVSIVDHGKSFNFYDVKQYDVEEAFQEKRQGGFGLYIIQRSVDEIRYEKDPSGGNRLTLVKKIHPD